jgi:hypothetical protein
MLYLRTKAMTRRQTKLRRLYSFADEGRRDREMRNAYDTLSGKPKKMSFAIHKCSWENGCEVVDWTEFVQGTAKSLFSINWSTSYLV